MKLWPFENVHTPHLPEICPSWLLSERSVVWSRHWLSVRSYPAWTLCKWEVRQIHHQTAYTCLKGLWAPNAFSYFYGQRLLYKQIVQSSALAGTLRPRRKNPRQWQDFFNLAALRTLSVENCPVFETLHSSLMSFLFYRPIKIMTGWSLATLNNSNGKTDPGCVRVATTNTWNECKYSF